MKKYLGSSMSIYVGIFLPVFSIFPVFLRILALTSEITVATVFIFLMCLLCMSILIAYLIKVSSQLYSWGSFDNKEVKIKSWFKKEYIMEYSKCTDVGTGYYVHGVLNSKTGTKFNYIYISYIEIDEKLRQT